MLLGRDAQDLNTPCTRSERPGQRTRHNEQQIAGVKGTYAGRKSLPGDPRRDPHPADKVKCIVHGIERRTFA